MKVRAKEKMMEKLTIKTMGRMTTKMMQRNNSKNLFKQISLSVAILSLICIINLIYLAPVLADQNTPVSMDFKGADIRDVLRTLSQLANVNLLTNKSVQGEVTISLKNVPFNEAIGLITLTNGLDYRWVGNTLIIARPDEMNQSFPENGLKTFTIQYANLDKVKEVLSTLLSGAKITVDDRTHSVIVSGSKDQLTQAESVIINLDRPIEQVFLDVQVEEVSTTGVTQSGVPSGTYARLKLLTDAKGIITDVSVELPTLIEALKKDGLAKTLANPGLVTLDGQTAKLLIGDKIPVESQEQEKETTKTVITYIEAGIRLEFTPRISSDGYITLNVKPQVSSLGEEVTKGYPMIKTREAETVVRIKDGQTFVIGGLIKDEDRNSVEKIPILGDIPILKALFSHKDTNKQSAEIVIFITPHIIKIDENGANKFGTTPRTEPVIGNTGDKK